MYTLPLRGSCREELRTVPIAVLLHAFRMHIYIFILCISLLCTCAHIYARLHNFPS